jgi:hypothetical protein
MWREPECLGNFILWKCLRSEGSQRCVLHAGFRVLKSESTIAAKTQKPKAKSQWPTAAFFAHHGDLSSGVLLRKNASFADTL